MIENGDMSAKQRINVDGFNEQALAKVLGRSDDQSIRSIAADLGRYFRSYP
jgi:hypothetical protein